MPTDNPIVEDAVENDLESDSQQIISKQCNESVPRDSIDAIELELESAVDKCAKLHNNQRSSNRLNKRSRKDNSSVDNVVKKAANIKQDDPSIRSKTRRPWELWSVEDKNAFFEALCEYGKDFESIQSYIAQKSKKKGVTTNMIKNKDQVRHFYYRTWHKISKFLEISEYVQKQTQELYGLINYAELRKKIGGCLNEKNRLKLRELVFNGVTTVKYKGKKLRIKTPVCRALKKLNNFADSKEPESEKLPKDIFVEFRPYTNTAWLQVQNLAQNPRVRTKVCLQKRLRPVIEYLQKRWKPYRLKRKEQVLNSLPKYNSEEYFCDTQPVLRVKPPRGVKIFPLSLSAIDTASSSDVCLEKYMELSNKSLCKDIHKSRKGISVKPKSQSDKLNDTSEMVLEKADDFVDNIGEFCDNYSFIDMSDLCQKGNKSADDNCYINLLTPPKSVPELEQPVEQHLAEVQRSLPSLTSIVDSAMTQTSILTSNLDVISEDIDCGSLMCANNNKSSDVPNGTEQKDISSDINLDSNLSNFNLKSISMANYSRLNPRRDLFPSEMISEKDKGTVGKPDLSKSKNLSEEDESIYCKTVRHGWTVDDAGFLTFGELYLLFGKPPLIILEYEFEYPGTTLTSTEEETEKTVRATIELSPLLNKVYCLAHSFFADPKQKQLPGKQHGRNNTSKSTKLKTCGLNDKISKDYHASQANPNPELSLTSKGVTTTETLLPNMPTSLNDNSLSSEKHVFIMPVGTAPRSIKPPDQNSLKEEIGKLLPCTRRGCRVRRKPLVVQRPLLPREGMRAISGPRPMTVVHIVPSVSPLTAVIPSACSRSKNKISIPSAKKIVNILTPGTTVDMHPIQVPVINQLHTDSGQNIILQRSSILSPHLIVKSSSAESIQIMNNSMTGVNPSVCESTLNVQLGSSQNPSQSIISEAELSSADLNTLNLELLTGHHKGMNESKESYASLSQLSLSDAANSLASSVSPSTSFLDEFGLVTKSSMYDSANLPSCFNTDIAASKECTSSDNSSHNSFRINSAEIQWLNGESTELSLNTFLNSMESPSKMNSSASSNLTENSNLDPIVRLAPVVDSQVRCLLDECSIDFITKFEDLADVINNSSSSDSKQT